MSEGVAVVWLDPGHAHEAAAHALDAWARAHGVALAPLRPTTGTGIGVDLAVGDRVEQELARAREAIAGTDGDGVDQALARAEALLREHPELPEGAWLRAEVERSWSSRWLRLAPRDDARARAAWERGEALDEGRVAGIGELGAGPARAKSRVRFVVRGVRVPSRLAFRVDGIALPPTSTAASTVTYEVSLAPAEHQIIVASDGRVVHAAWAVTSDAPVEIDVDASERPTACSVEDLAAVRREGTRLLAAGVACGQWLVAVPTPAPSDPEALLVARCSADQCGPLVEWRVARVALPGPPTPVPATSERKRWPAWATWTLVGFGAAGAAVVGIVASGVLQSRATVQRFTVGGLRQE